ncbi:MAG TPA: dihydropteroate synthase [Thermoanaerobaculia bacterium]|nr:dihydropteroate synthase [Thermoanaerobaculia bacterium]
MHETISLTRGRILSLGPLPGVMAILNVTPDSFSDGGRFASAEAAAEEGARYADLGAAIIDVGGESTRPKGRTYGEGAREISLNEEIARVIPVLSSLRRKLPSLPLSIDTRRAEVASAALDAGADVVNVVTGLTASDELLSTIATARAAVILNHCRGTPQTTFEESSFTDVIAEVAADLNAACSRALSSGISEQKILLDPGFGFGKTPDQNFALLGALDLLAPPGVPLVVGASRKAFLGAVAGAPVNDRLPESLAAVAVAARLAPRRPVLVRVHDVAPTIRFLAALARANGDALSRVT